jgi:hypothetical protein
LPANFRVNSSGKQAFYNKVTITNEIFFIFQAKAGKVLKLKKHHSEKYACFATHVN